jgi:hypothetical protein
VFASPGQVVATHIHAAQIDIGPQQRRVRGSAPQDSRDGVRPRGPAARGSPPARPPGRLVGIGARALGTGLGQCESRAGGGPDGALRSASAGVASSLTRRLAARRIRPGLGFAEHACARLNTGTVPDGRPSSIAPWQRLAVPRTSPAVPGREPFGHGAHASRLLSRAAACAAAPRMLFGAAEMLFHAARERDDRGNTPRLSSSRTPRRPSELGDDGAAGAVLPGLPRRARAVLVQHARDDEQSGPRSAGSSCRASSTFDGSSPWSRTGAASCMMRVKETAGR